MTYGFMEEWMCPKVVAELPRAALTSTRNVTTAFGRPYDGNRQPPAWHGLSGVSELFALMAHERRRIACCSSVYRSGVCGWRRVEILAFFFRGCDRAATMPPQGSVKFLA